MKCAMMSALAAAEPAEEHRDELMLFGQFVGDWTFQVKVFRPDGTTDVEHGEWSFGWILEGRGIQDVWRVPSLAESPTPRRYGTTIRLFDRQTRGWRCTWHGLHDGTVLSFVARQVEDEIVLEKSDGGGIVRWIFSDVVADSFSWRKIRLDGGAWHLEEELRARRID